VPSIISAIVSMPPRPLTCISLLIHKIRPTTLDKLYLLALTPDSLSDADSQLLLFSQLLRAGISISQTHIPAVELSMSILPCAGPVTFSHIY
jgi:hypothetical protein